jgi:hypothetical protein
LRRWRISTCALSAAATTDDRTLAIAHLHDPFVSWRWSCRLTLTVRSILQLCK